MIDPDFQAWNCPLSGVTLIEASAGTGKTYNLEQLYLRLVVERGLPVRQILVITFTRTATAELRERIRRQLRLACEEATHQGTGLGGGAMSLPDGAQGLDATERRRRLEEAVATFDEAAIMTIHGFCQRALSEQPFASATPLSIDPGLDDRDLKTQVLHDFWRRLFAHGNLPQVLLDSLLDEADPVAEAGKWLDWRLAKPLVRLIAPPARLSAPGSEDDPDALDVQARMRFEALCGLPESSLEQARDWLLRPELGLRPRPQQRWLAARFDALRAHRTRAQGWRREPGETVRKLDPRTFGFASAEQAAAVTWPEVFVRLREWLEALEPLQACLDQSQREIRYLLLTEAPAALIALKARTRTVSFDDMLSNLYRRLTDPAFSGLARELSHRYPAALVDEFQDTDPLQWEILNAIYGKPARLTSRPPADLGGSADETPKPLLVLVGDPKQSIYRFRNADLRVYLRARNRADQRYTLLNNYRSSRSLIAAVNALFEYNPQVFIQPGLSFAAARVGPRHPDAELPLLIDTRPTEPINPTEPSNPGKPGDSASPANPASLRLWMLGEHQGRWLTRSEAIEASLQATRQEIVRLLAGAGDGTVRLGDRPLAPGDLMVLVLTHQQGQRMRALLAQAGVASVERSQRSVLESAEAEALEQVLAAILQPLDRGLVHRALSSTLMGYDADRIAALSENDAEAAALIERFSAYRERWQTRGFPAMLRLLTEEAEVPARWLGEPDGERRLTNLRHLQEILQAAAQEAETPAALFAAFERERREALAGNRPDERLLRLESDADRVQILTVHSAKGLASPVVFCPTLFAASGQGTHGPDAEVLHEPDSEPVLDLSRPADPQTSQTAETRLALESSAELLRLIYVALTRAHHRCYLTVGPYSSSRSEKPFRRAPLNWCIAGAGREPAQWFTDKDPPCSSADLISRWEHFARDHAPVVMLGPLPGYASGESVRLEKPRTEASRIEALAAPRSVPRTWRRTSYSHLVRGASHERSAIDHDHHFAKIDPDPDQVETDHDLLFFPIGATAGECIHTVFEVCTFDDRGTWPSAIEQGLRRHREPRWPGQPHEPKLERMLGNVLGCPLVDGFRLSDLNARQRLTEWSFTMHCPSIDPPALSRCLRDHGYDAPDLNARMLQGYLNGFVDLIFEHQGRFYLVDWKSNHLGYRREHYDPARLAESMTRESYTLQYLLYTVALDAYLHNRLRERYDYEEHFGEVMYLFVRGMRPDWSDETGQACGVFRDRPRRALIEALRRQLLAP